MGEYALKVGGFLFGSDIVMTRVKRLLLKCCQGKGASVETGKSLHVIASLVGVF